MLNTSFPPWPSFSEEEATAVADTIRSGRVNYWTGTECREFEREFAAWAGAKHAVALTNGSLALEAAISALGIRPGDEVIVTPRSFVASVTCVIPAGAVPVFADVDRDTQNISAETIAPCITPRTRAIIPVHLGGMPCDMDPIMDLARSHGLAVLEDCAQAHGARYKGRGVGTIGDIGAWSFCQDKIVTTGGEGGMVTTNGAELCSSVWSFKDHGKSLAALEDRPQSFEFLWVHDSFGTNARMLEVQAVIGRIQLRKVADWSARRRAHAERIWAAAREISGLRAPEIPQWAEHAAYRAYLFVEPDALHAGWNRDRIIAAINECGVPCYTGVCPEIYLERAFDGTPWRPAQRLPVAAELGETSFTLLVHPTLEESHIDRTCSVLAEVMRAARR